MVKFEIKSTYNLKSIDLIKLMLNNDYYSYCTKNNKNMNFIRLVDFKKEGNIINSIIEYSATPNIPKLILNILGSKGKSVTREMVTYNLNNSSVSVVVKSDILDVCKSSLTYSYKLYNIDVNKCLKISRYTINSDYKGASDIILKNMEKNIRKNNLITSNLINDYIKKI